MRFDIARDDERRQLIGPLSVTTSDALKGVARMYSTLIEGSGYLVEVFSDRESAARWLDDNKPAS
jgi:hypothetical protein